MVDVLPSCLVYIHSSASNMSLIGKTIKLMTMQDKHLDLVADWMNGDVARTYYRDDPSIYPASSGEFCSPNAFIIEHLAEEKAIGLIKFRSVCPLHQSLVYDIYVHDGHRNSHAAIEATLLALGYAYDYLDIHRVEMTIYSNNDQALKVSEKFGFKRDAILREGRRVDAIILGLLRSEFHGSRKIARWGGRLLKQRKKPRK